MGPLRRRVAYLSGLAAGLNLPSQSPEGRVLAGVVEALEAMAEEIQRLDQRVGELAEYLGELDEDLYDLEESVAGEMAPPKRHRSEGRAWLAAGGETAAGGQSEAAGRRAEGFGIGAPDTPQDQGADEAGADGEDALILECPRCGSRYSVSADQLEFDWEPDEDQQEFEWVCPHCGEVVHDYLPDADVHEDGEPLTAQGSTREQGQGSQQGAAGNPAGATRAHAPSPAP